MPVWCSTKRVADDEPSGWPVDAAELGADQIGAFGRQRVDRLAAVRDAADEEPAQQPGARQLQQPRVGAAWWN